MTISQTKLIEDYNSLRSKAPSSSIGLIIQFCSYFQTDDPELFKEFERAIASSYSETIGTNKLIDLYAKRYNLNPQTDIEQIMHLFINNTLTNGISYHLNSSANFPSIMEQGLGISAIGLKTEERQDYERLKAAIDPDTFKMLQPFHREKEGSKLYFSNIPILKARYGDRPEWLKELKSNSFIVKDNPEARTLVDEVLHKYDQKYEFAEKMLFLIPNPAPTISDEILGELQKNMSPRDIINYLHNGLLTQKDLYTNRHIASSNIIAVDLKSHNMYIRKEDGTVAEVEPTLNNTSKK